MPPEILSTISDQVRNKQNSKTTDDGKMVHFEFWYVLLIIQLLKNWLALRLISLLVLAYITDRFSHDMAHFSIELLFQ